MSCSNNLIDLTGGWSCYDDADSIKIVPNRASSSSSNVDRQYSKLRYWEDVESTSDNLKKKGGIAFRLMSYNILAQLLLEFHSYLYKECSEEHLIWNTRFDRIYKEIISQNPDILCLQELQTSHVEVFDTHLKKAGYKYIYKQRTGIRVDGCAIFYKSTVFDLIEHQSIEFRQPSTDILNRDNIGLMAKLRPKIMPSAPFVVCTTHLLYNPRRTDVRLAQAQVFLAEIDRFIFHVDRKTKRYQFLPVVITGDFNSKPESPVVRLLSTGHVNFQQNNAGLRNIAVTDLCQHLGVYLRRRKLVEIRDRELSLLYHSERETLEEDEAAAAYDTGLPYEFDSYETFFNRGHIKHRLNLRSVYKFGEDGRSEVTTHHDDWMTVDYMFYGSGNASELRLLERFRLPTEEECEAAGPIPNDQFGSDHFSLAAGFLLIPPKPLSSF